jgi:hypothetical protein
MKNILFLISFFVCSGYLFGQTNIKNPKFSNVPEYLLAPDSVLAVASDPSGSTAKEVKNVPWADFLSLTGDNLGNHKATQQLNLDGNTLVNVSSGWFDEIILFSPTTDNAIDAVLVRDPANGKFRIRDAGTISGGGGETNTASNLGGGEGVFGSKSGVDLRFKSLVAGTNVTLGSDANTITINALGGGGTGIAVLDFAEAGGTEGVGIGQAAAEANWALLKTLENQQDSSGLSIYFPPGVWEMQPAILEFWENIWDNDHIEWDGPTTILGAGRDRTLISLPNRGYYFLFRQRTWSGDLTIKDISIKTSIPDNAQFTANATTDVINMPGHGLLTGISSLKFITDDTLPAPLLTSARAVPIVIDADNFVLAGENGSYGLLSPRGITGDAGADTLLKVGHAYANDTPVAFYALEGGVLPGGVTAGQRYYVINQTANNFQISLTVGGAAVDITSTGSGSIWCQDIINITSAGVGTHTMYALDNNALVQAGYDIGATMGSGVDTGTDRITCEMVNCEFEYISVFNKTNSNSTVNARITNCLIKNNLGVSIYLGGSNGGTVEGVDFQRSDNLIADNVFIGPKETGDIPFGSHFIYTQTEGNTVISNNILRGSFTYAVDFQSESLPNGAGNQLVEGNAFDNNQWHIWGGQAQDKRSALNITGNSFRRDGIVALRGDASFTGNYAEIITSPWFGVSSTPGDVLQQPDDFVISNNQFVIKSVTGSNAVIGLEREGDHKVLFSNNVIKIDPDITTTVYMGSLGDTEGTDLPTIILSNNLYDYDTGTRDVFGWYTYQCNLICDGERAYNITALVIPVADGGGGSITLSNCTLDPSDLAAAKRFGISCAQPNWSINGTNNKFFGGCFQVMPGDQLITMGQGRNPTSITAAATVYVDPSYDEHVVTGTTTIDTIDIGVTGNVAANGAGTNHNDAWSGSITLIVPSGLTISAGGNIANGPITTTGVDAIRLIRIDDDTWRIVE